MATRTAGAKVVLDGENEYKQALTSLNDGNRVLASEMKKLQAEYKGNSDSVEFLTKKGGSCWIRKKRSKLCVRRSKTRPRNTARALRRP